MITSKTRVIAVHLLNDFSGSPAVLRQVLESLDLQKYELHLFTSTSRSKGMLSGVRGVKAHAIHYRHGGQRFLTLLLFSWAQLQLMIRLLFFLRRGDLVYINSLLPFAAGLAARVRKCRVVYHLHELSIRPKGLKRLLLFAASHTGNEFVYVSHFLQSRLPIEGKTRVIYNVLPSSFLERADHFLPSGKEQFVVLMLCSLRRYKGIDHFVELASRMRRIRFELVLNASWPEISNYFHGRSLPPNLVIYDAQEDVHSFLQRASLVVNLSIPTEWIETFGLTILEAMAYRLPVIVPKVGGVTELVEHGENGFCLDSGDYRQLILVLELLSTNPTCYQRMSMAAWHRSRLFRSHEFKIQVNDLIRSQVPDERYYKLIKQHI